MLKNVRSKDVKAILACAKGDVYEFVITTLNTGTVQSEMKVGIWAVKISASKNSLINSLCEVGVCYAQPL